MKYRKLKKYLDEQENYFKSGKVVFDEQKPNVEVFAWESMAVVKPEVQVINLTEEPAVVKKPRAKKEPVYKPRGSKYDTSMYSSGEDDEEENDVSVIEDDEISLEPVNQLNGVKSKGGLKERVLNQRTNIEEVLDKGIYDMMSVYGLKTSVLVKPELPIMYGKRNKVLKRLGDLMRCGICQTTFQRRNAKVHFMSNVHIAAWTKKARRNIV